MRGNRSRYEVMMDCPRKYFYMYNPQVGAPRGLVKPRPAPALRIGLAVHAFLETWYDNLDTPTDERLQISLTSMTTSLDESRGMILGIGDEEKTERELRNETDLICTQYVKRWGTQEEFGVLQPEVRGEIPLGKHIFVFRTDAIVSKDDRLWLLEHKTTWNLGPKFLNQFLLNHQITSYVWGSSQLMGTLIHGVMLNALRKPMKQSHVPAPEYYRETFLVTADHITGMLESFHYTFSDIESRDPTNRKEWPQDTNRCHDYNGCPYWEICALGAEAEVGQIYKSREADYVENPNLLQPNVTPTR